MKIAHLLLVSCLIGFASLPTAAAQSWTRFRGPNGQGVADAASVPISWSTQECRWRVLLPGPGSSSPVVDGSQIFVTCGLEDGTRIIRCLRTEDGGLIWKRSFEGHTARMHSTNNYAPSTPAVDGERVYMMWGSNAEFVVVALTRDRGEEIWRRELGTFETVHGFGASPMVYDDRLIVPCEHDGESFVTALDASSGATLWKTPRESAEASYATPALFTPEGGRPQIVCASWAHGAYALDPETGAELWETPVMEYRVVASPVFADDLVFISGGKGGIGRQMFAVRAGCPERGVDSEVAYEVTGRVPYVPTTVVRNDMVFLCCDKGDFRCLRASTGEELGANRIPDSFYGSPIVLGDRLYAVSRKGKMVVLSASPQLELLATIDLEEPSDATPAVADGVLYIRTETHLMAIGGR